MAKRSTLWSSNALKSTIVSRVWRAEGWGSLTSLASIETLWCGQTRWLGYRKKGAVGRRRYLADIVAVDQKQNIIKQTQDNRMNIKRKPLTWDFLSEVNHCCVVASRFNVCFCMKNEQKKWAIHKIYNIHRVSEKYTRINESTGSQHSSLWTGGIFSCFGS